MDEPDRDVPSDIAALVEQHDLGAELERHRSSRSGRGLLLLFGLLGLSGAGYLAGIALLSEGLTYFAREGAWIGAVMVGVLGVGSALLVRDQWSALRHPPLLVLHQRGLVLARRHRREVFAWRDVDHWQPTAIQRGMLIRTYTLVLRRTDGTRFLLAQDPRDNDQFGIKHQFVIEDAAALGQRIIRMILDHGGRDSAHWATLMAGSAVMFGPVTLAPEGIRFPSGETVTLGTFDWVGVRNGRLALRTPQKGGTWHETNVPADTIPQVEDLVVCANRLVLLTTHASATIGVPSR